MASTVKAELDRANPSNLADLIRLAELGKGLAMCVPRTERLTVTANIGTPAYPARQILRCWASVGGSTGNKAVAAPESTPGAGNCAVSEDGTIEFAAADAVTACEVTYLPLEGELISETIPVTAGGLGTLNNSRVCIQIVSATLVAPAATPGAKTPVARGTAGGALAAGQCTVTAAGTGIQFVAAEAAAACTATVSYYAYPGVNTTDEDPFGDRLDAAFTPV